MCLSLRLAIQVTAPFRHRANIRDGIEDWELLSRLGHDSDTLISNAADLIRQTVRSDTEREEDPGLLERLRRDAARRIIAMKHDDLNSTLQYMARPMEACRVIASNITTGRNPGWTWGCGPFTANDSSWVSLPWVSAGGGGDTGNGVLVADQLFTDFGKPSLIKMPREGVLRRPNIGLNDSWAATLTRFVETTVLPRLKNKTAVGVFLGDEICCHNSSCCEISAVQKAPSLSHLKRLLVWQGKESFTRSLRSCERCSGRMRCCTRTNAKIASAARARGDVSL